MHHSAGGNILKRQSVANQNVSLRSRTDGTTYLETYGADDVTLLAIGVVQQRNTRRTIWIVFNCGDLRHDAGLVAFEIDDAVSLLCAASAKTAGNPAMRIAAA